MLHNRSPVRDISETLRIKYDYSPVDHAGAFAVSNARLKLDGKVTSNIGYRLQIYLCNNGKIRLVDAYARLTPTTGMDIYLGQERVPFSVDASRDLNDYVFTDLPLGAGYLGNLRSVGAKIGYLFFHGKAYVETGIFNNGSTDSHGVSAGDNNRLTAMIILQF